MQFLQNNFLTLLIFLPAAGAFAVLLTPTRRAARGTALGTTLATFLLSVVLLGGFDFAGGTGYAYSDQGGVVQYVQRADWIPAFDVQYLVGVDGLSLPLVLLTTFIFVLAAVASWDVGRMTRGYFSLLLFLQTGVLGTFLSLDLFLFYVFFEVSLLPMYFLIGIWGGPRKEYAAIKFFLYTLVGSIALLIVVIGTYLYSRGLPLDVREQAGIAAGTFDLIKLAHPAVQDALGAAGMVGGVAKTFFVLAMLAFFVKLPAVPFHTWLPDAHVEAPTPISMILAAILLKMGGYGMLRIAYPLFPEAGRYFWWLVGLVGVVSIIYGALCAMAQTDFKRLVAYSSVSHMGFVVLGIAMMTGTSVNGALFMMVAHGIVSAMLFYVVGVAYDRAHHRDLSRLGGLATTMPVYTGLSAVACFANLGLPGLCSFIGEVMVIMGTFQAARPDSILMGYADHPRAYYTILTFGVLACLGMVLAAAYMLWTVQRVFFGPERPEHKGFAEVNAREVTVLAPLAAMAILLGILPAVFVFAYTERTLVVLLRLLS